MQAIHRILWRSSSSTDVGFTYIEDDSAGDPTDRIDLAGTPVIVSRSHGIAVGMLVDDDYRFGLITSSITTRSYVTAWRTAQLLPYVRTVRYVDGKFESTLDHLVTATAGDCSVQLLEALCGDFNCTSGEDFLDLFEEVGKWPRCDDLIGVWGLLSNRERQDLIPVLRAAIGDGTFDASSGLIDRIEAAERYATTPATSLGALAVHNVGIRS